MSGITIPTAPSDEAPYFLDSEHQEPGPEFGTRRYVVAIATEHERRFRLVAKVMDESEDEARRRALTACRALNAAHMAVELSTGTGGRLVTSDANGFETHLFRIGETVTLVTWTPSRPTSSDLDRETAAALGLALIEFAATGKLPGEES